ncbi:response regulator transcription factor [Achromobacter seleniivolatilans]|uniref:Response regulator transcription factor n=1 Tax=Achromobacter seleniivolatilans TaxID=3047478 RepID=A0ABY9LZQ1_9BURK|nr:response regulator transcription factor [Achromobacter sp. R39]WMD20234.1 response regulator transcription factor [Achromobacter sp. R39]
MHPTRVKLAILDSHPLVIQGLTAIFADYIDFDVLGTFDDSVGLLDMMLATPANVVLMEYFLDNTNQDGAQLIPILRQRHPGARIVIFSATQDPSIAALALRQGAHGYINKTASENTIIEALRRVHGGGRFVDPAIRHLLPDSLFPIRRSGASEGPVGRMQALLDSAELSPSESMVVKKFVAGENVMEIAARLRKSPKTVSTQKAAAFRKLGVSSDSGLYRLISSAGELH